MPVPGVVMSGAFSIVTSESPTRFKFLFSTASMNFPALRSDRSSWFTLARHDRRGLNIGCAIGTLVQINVVGLILLPFSFVTPHPALDPMQQVQPHFRAEQAIQHGRNQPTLIPGPEVAMARLIGRAVGIAQPVP